MFYVIDASNSVHNTDNTPLGGIALQLGAGDGAVVQADGSLIASGSSGTGIYVNAYADNSTLIVNGFVYGTSEGIYSLASGVKMTINGNVVGGSTGVGISGGNLYMSPTGVVSGGMSIAGASVSNDGTINGEVQLSSGWLYNNRLISSTGIGIFFSADGDGTIVNTGTIQGDLSTYYAAVGAVRLDIENSGDWVGTLGLAPGDDYVVNTGKITGDVNLREGNNTLDSRHGFIGGDISAGGGVDTILLGGEDNIITGGGGGDTIDGGAGFDIVSYSNGTAAVSVDLMNRTASRGDAQGDRLSNIEGLYGTLYNDILVGDDNNNTLHGVVGSDRLTGNGGDDTIITWGGGRTLIDGGTGNDLIQLTTYDTATYGNAFNSATEVNGGSGYDTLEITKAPLMNFTANTVKGIEHFVVLGDFNYNFTAVDGTVAGGARMWVDAGGLTGVRSIVYNGAAETNGAYDFTGGEYRDTFTGGAGADTFNGGAQKDTMTGGGGADLFIYESSADSLFANRDWVKDFDTAADTFKLNVAVTGVDAVVTGSASNASELAALVSGKFFASHAVLVNVTGGTLAGQSLLLVDANNVAGYQSASDYVIEVTGITGTLTTGDFIFG